MQHAVTVAPSADEPAIFEAAELRSRIHSIEPSRFDIRVDLHTPAEWDEIAAGFTDITFDQTAVFSGIQWGMDRVSDISLWQDGVCMAGARIAVLTPPLMGKGVAYVRSGPFWRRAGNTPDRQVYREALRAIVAEYGIRRGHSVVVVPRPNPEYYFDDVASLKSLGFTIKRRHPDPNRYFVNLGLDEAEQMVSLGHKWRYNLRKALKNDLDIEHGESPEHITCFLSLHRSMVERKGYYDTDPVSHLAELMRDLPGSLRPRIFILRKDGEPLAGAVVAPLGDTALYLFGASTDVALPMNAGYALQWWIVRNLSQEGFRWYDLGGEAMSIGLRQFKRGLVGKKGRIVPLGNDFEFATTWCGSAAAEIIFAARWGRRIFRRCVETAQKVGV
jgi:hypothetical protein